MEHMVVFDVGPVPMRAARRWLTHARSNVTTLRLSAHGTIPALVLDEFQTLVEQWSGSLDDGDTFRWQSLVPVERVRRLSVFWAIAARAVRSQSELSPPPHEARPFYDALVSGVAAALAAADEGGIAPTLRAVMPRFDDGQHATPHSEPAAVRARRRLLIVEDAPDVRLLLRIGLRDYSEVVIVGEAVDGLDALARATEVMPDVVLLDVVLPRMSGIEVLPHLRSQLPNARIVGFSATDDHEPAARAAGADDFVLKGAALDVLVRTLVASDVTR